MKFASFNPEVASKTVSMSSVNYKILGISGNLLILLVHISCLPIFNSSVLIEN